MNKFFLLFLFILHHEHLLNETFSIILVILHINVYVNVFVNIYIFNLIAAVSNHAAKIARIHFQIQKSRLSIAFHRKSGFLPNTICSFFLTDFTAYPALSSLHPFSEWKGWRRVLRRRWRRLLRPFAELPGCSFHQ